MAVIHAVRGRVGTRPWERARTIALYTGLGVGAIALGAALAVVASAFEEASPLVMVGLPLVPVAIVAVMVSPIVGPLIVVATLPFGSLGASIGPVTVQVAEGAALVVGMLTIVRRLAVGKSPLPFARELIWPVLLLGWTLVALYSAVDEGLAIKQFISLLGGLLLAASVLASCRDVRAVRTLLTFLTAVGLFVAIISLATNHKLEATHGATEV